MPFRNVVLPLGVQTVPQQNEVIKTPQMWCSTDCRFQLKSEIFPLALDTAHFVLVARLMIASIAFGTLKNANLERIVTSF
jgi:hypothetical protein